MSGKVLTSDNDKRAIWFWQRVLEQDPKHCVAYVHLGIAAAKSGDRGKALLMAKRAEKLNPTALDLLEIGRLYHELGKFRIAVDTYLNAGKLGFEPKGLLYASIADCYFCLGEKKTAHQYADWAIRSNPEHDYVKTVWQDCKGI